MNYFDFFKKIKFDPRLTKTIQHGWLSNFRLPILLIFTILILGIFSFSNLPRRLNPEINIPIVSITTFLPGASPKDVEKLITIPIEEAVKEVKGIDRISSTSQEGFSGVTIRFKSGTDRNQARNEVQSAIDTINLPEDASKPRVFLFDFENRPLINFVLTSNNDFVSLINSAKLLKKEIENLAEIEKVDIYDYDSSFVEVYLSPEKMAEYKINPLILSQAISKQIKSYPSGNIETKDLSFLLTINSQINSLDDLRNLLININGKNLKLSEIAVISEKQSSQKSKVFFSKKQNEIVPAVQFLVYRSSGADIYKSEEKVKEKINQFIKNNKNNLEVYYTENTAERIKEQFDDLLGEFRSTIGLIFLILLIFIGLRQAVISSLTIPLTFLSAFTIMNIFNLSLNFITLFALLIALGILIDDTIVIVDAMTKYYKTEKFTPLQTGLLVWRDFIVPLWTTTLTTIWAFLPLLITSGIIGEFIKAIPIVITSTMLSSTLIALLVTIPLMIFLLKPEIPKRVIIFLKIVSGLIIIFSAIFLIQKSNFFILIFLNLILISLIYKQKLKNWIKKTGNILKNNLILKKISKVADKGLVNLETLSNKYLLILEKIFSSSANIKKTMIFLICFVLVSYALIPLGLIKNEFFPKTDQDIVYIQGAMPLGSNQEKTEKTMINLMKKISFAEEFIFIMGESSIEISPNFSKNNQPNSFLITIKLKPAEQRKNTSNQIAQNLREKFKNFEEAKISVIELTGGPPSGADITLSLKGDDLNTLNQLSDKLTDYLKKQEGVINIEKSVKQGTSKIVFKPDFYKMNEYNLTVDNIGFWLRTYITGFKLEKIKINNENIDIIFKLTKNNPSPEELTSFIIPTQKGPMPISNFGSFYLEENPNIIQRDKGQRTITVTANVLPGFSPPEKNRQLQKFVENLNLPEGYSWETGGANEENIRSVQSIIQAMIISVILILATIVIEFKSFRQTTIALLTIPLSFSGVLYLFAIFRIPLSFPALIGVLALFGIVVKNAIVIIEKINTNLKEGITFKKAIIEGATTRIEPVILTSLTTIAGLIPITISDPIWRGLGGAIITGLVFSGILMLFFIPTAYYLIFKKDRKKLA